MENEVNNNTPIENNMNNLNNTTNNAAPKKSGVAKIIIIIVTVLVVAGGIAFAAMSLSSKKKPGAISKEIDKVAVYNNAINTTFGKINQVVDEMGNAQERFQIGDKALYFTGDIKIDSNISELQSLGIDISKYKLNMEMGLDSKNKQIQLGAGLNDTLKAQLYYKNDRVYIVSNVLDNPIDITSELETEINVSDFDEVSYAFDQLNQIEALELDDKIKVIIETFEQAIVEAIDEEKIESEESSYEVNGEKVEATKLTLTIDEEIVKGIIEKVVAKSENDEELINALATIMGVSETEIKAVFEELDTEDLSFEEKIYINVYVQKDSENATGFNIQIDDEELLSFYTYNGNLVLTLTAEDEKVTFQTEKKDNGTTFALKEGSEEIMTGTIRQFDDKKIDCDVTINDGTDKVGLSIYTTIDEKESSVSGEYNYKLSMNDQYLGVSGKYSLESKDSLGNIDVSNAVTPDSVDSEKVLTNIQNKIASNADLKTLFDLLQS